MASVSSLSFSAITESSTSSYRKLNNANPSKTSYSYSSLSFKFRSSSSFSFNSLNLIKSSSNANTSPFVVHCNDSSSTVPPTVADTKLKFLESYKRPIPSIYNNVLQELIVQHHLMRYKKSHQYDAVFALGFVTVYDRLMEGYPSDEDRTAIFQAYINALNEDPQKYRADAQKLEEWARAQTVSTLIEFSSKEGEVEAILKDIAERAASKGRFSYSRFFAIGLFRLLELANITDSTVLDKLCTALNVNKKSVDRDLSIYRNLLTKLVQAKELLKEYTDREKKKQEERARSQKPNNAVTT